MEKFEKCNIHACLQASNKRLIETKHNLKLQDSLLPPSQSDAARFAIHLANHTDHNSIVKTLECYWEKYQIFQCTPVSTAMYTEINSEGNGNEGVSKSRSASAHNTQRIDAQGRTVAERLGSSLNTDISKSAANYKPQVIPKNGLTCIPQLLMRSDTWSAHSRVSTPSKHRKHSHAIGKELFEVNSSQVPLNSSKCTTPSHRTGSVSAVTNHDTSFNAYTPPSTVPSAKAPTRSPSRKYRMSHRELSVTSIQSPVAVPGSVDALENAENSDMPLKSEQNNSEDCNKGSFIEGTNHSAVELSPYEKYGIDQYIPMAPYKRVQTPPKPIVVAKVTRYHGNIDKFCVLNRRIGLYDNASIIRATDSRCIPYLNDCIMHPNERHSTDKPESKGILKLSIVDDLVAQEEEEMERARAEHMMRLISVSNATKETEAESHSHSNFASAAAHNAEVQAAIANTVTAAVHQSFMSKNMQELTKTVSSMKEHNDMLAKEHDKVVQMGKTSVNNFSKAHRDMILKEKLTEQKHSNLLLEKEFQKHQKLLNRYYLSNFKLNLSMGENQGEFDFRTHSEELNATVENNNGSNSLYDHCGDMNSSWILTSLPQQKKTPPGTFKNKKQSGSVLKSINKLQKTCNHGDGIHNKADMINMSCGFFEVDRTAINNKKLVHEQIALEKCRKEDNWLHLLERKWVFDVIRDLLQVYEKLKTSHDKALNDNISMTDVSPNPFQVFKGLFRLVYAIVIYLEIDYCNVDTHAANAGKGIDKETILLFEEHLIPATDYEYQHLMLRKEFVNSMHRNRCYFLSLLESQIFVGNSTACTSSSSNAISSTQSPVKNLGASTAQKLMAQYFVILVSLLEVIEHVVLRNLPPDDEKTGEYASQSTFSDPMRRRTSSASSCSSIVIKHPPICSILEFWDHLDLKMLLIHKNPLYLQRYDAINPPNSLTGKNSK